MRNNANWFLMLTILNAEPNKCYDAIFKINS